MSNVLSGKEPLTRTSMAGGISMSPGKMEEQMRFGQKTNVSTWGKRHLPIERVYEGYFGEQSQMGSLASQFSDYFKFYKQARKEDLKHQGRAGIYGMFKNFVDFKLWKKVFGMAKDPTVAALHQIRDIMIEEFEILAAEKGQSRSYKGRMDMDPVDMMTGLFALGKKSMGGGFSLKGLGKFGGQLFGAGKEAWQEEYDRPDITRMQERKGFFKDTSIGGELKKTWKEMRKDSSQDPKDPAVRSAIATERIANQLAPENDIASAMTNIEKGDKKRDKEEKKKKKGMGLLGIGLALGLAGAAVGMAVGNMFGGKGGIAGAIAGFLLPTIPLMLPMMFKLGVSLVGGLISSVGKVMWWLVKTGFTKVLPFLFKNMTKILPGAAAAGMFAMDIFGKGGGLEEFKKGNTMEGVLTTMFGRKKEIGDLSGAVSSTLGQVIKYASLGLLVGGPIGAVIGGVIGFLGGGWRSGMFKTIYEKWTGKGVAREEYKQYMEGEGTAKDAMVDIIFAEQKTADKDIKAAVKNSKGNIAAFGQNATAGGSFRKTIESYIKDSSDLKITDKEAIKAIATRDMLNSAIEIGEKGGKSAFAMGDSIAGGYSEKNIEAIQEYYKKELGIEGITASQINFQKQWVEVTLEQMKDASKKSEERLAAIQKATEETAASVKKQSTSGTIMYGSKKLYEDGKWDPKGKK